METNRVIVTHVSNDSGDWELLFVNSKLFAEGHSIRTDEWLDLMETYNGSKAKKYWGADEEMENGSSGILDYELKMELEEL